MQRLLLSLVLVFSGIILDHLLQLLTRLANYGLIKQPIRFLFYLQVHQLYSLYFKIQVGCPII